MEFAIILRRAKIKIAEYQEITWFSWSKHPLPLVLSLFVEMTVMRVIDVSINFIIIVNKFENPSMKISVKTHLLVISVFFFAACQSLQKDVAKREFSLNYEKFTLDNGLDVILHEDHSDPIVAVATLMHVGSNREKPGRTGFAHFFEHMSFNDSENVPRGANRKLIPEWGGQRNGGTWSDGTIYYEVVPKDAFDKILWIDSDRFGYMINTVTEAALEREKQVVKNEKRQRVDNAPYGFTDEIIRKNLYPEGHPYSWTVIGSLPDLQAATLEDVKEFYHQFYGAGNATLVIAGDIDVGEAKEKVQHWFGEIPKGPDVPKMDPMPVQLESTKSIYFEDNFAKLPELRMIFPTVEDYHPDLYALQFLGELLSSSKKSPLYRSIVEKKLAPSSLTYQNSSELAGEFIIRVRANANTDLDTIKAAIYRGLMLFEEEGFSDNELMRIKAGAETSLYQGISTVLNKAFQLVNDNEFGGDPGLIAKRAKEIQNVNRQDILRVYEKYIKNKPYVMTSVVPKGQMELAVSGSKEAEVYVEEVVSNVASEEVGQGDEAQYEKTPSKYDRSEPHFGDLPLFKAHEVCTTQMDNGLKIYGIENEELPLVYFDLTIQGGHWQEELDKVGVASLLAELMMEGTKTKNPAELEEAIGLLGSNINIISTDEDWRITASCLSRNFAQTLDLVDEILFEPRWDEKEFERLKKARITQLQGRKANPQYVASFVFDKLMYGTEHIMAYPSEGTVESIDKITIEDLKNYYKENFSPSISRFHVAGNVDKRGVIQALSSLNQNWSTTEVTIKSYPDASNDLAGKIFFIDVPGSKQSVIYAGQLVLPATENAFTKLSFANEKIGGGSSGALFQMLRIEKGYTYGAYAFVRPRKVKTPYTIVTSVRANATLPSLKIIRDMVGSYAQDFTQEDVSTTTTKVLKANTRAYESLGDKLGMLREISKFGKPVNYMEIEQQVLTSMTLEDYKEIIERFIVEKNMFYLVVGDGSTQFDEVKKFGQDPIILDAEGEILNL
jgi:zinc protease